MPQYQIATEEEQSIKSEHATLCSSARVMSPRSASTMFAADLLPTSVEARFASS